MQRVPGDDWSYSVTINGDDDQPLDFTGWAVEFAVIDYGGESAISVSVDTAQAASGVFGLSVTDAETAPVPFGRLSEITIQLKSLAGVGLTIVHANVEGVRTMSVASATFTLPGIQGKPGIGDKYDVALYVQGRPQAGERVARFVVARPFSLPVGLIDSAASAVTAATGTGVFSLARNDVQFGTVTFDASTTGALAAGAKTDFAAGDVLEVIAPASQDATLSDISITLAGDRITT